MKKTTIVLLLVLALIVTGCSKTDNRDTDNSKNNLQELSIGIANDPEGLDPHRTASTTTFQVTNNIYDTLLGVDTKGNLKPRLAKDWHVSDDGLTYTLELQENVFFHNGREMTAEDVKFSLERLTDDQSPKANDYKGIKEIRVESPATLVIELSTADITFPSLLAYPWAAIVPAEAVDTLKNKPIGTGPYILKEWIPQQHLVLEKNKDYFLGEATLDKVTIKTLPVSASQLTSLESGTVDVIYDVTGEMAKVIATKEDLKLINAPQYMVQVLALNNAHPALKDVRVRQAISMAIDKETIILGANDGFGDVIGSHMPSISPYYVDTTSVLKHDVERAKELLKEAGYENGLNLKLTLPKQYKLHVDSGQIIADQLSKIGINAEIEVIEWASWIKDVYTERKYEMTVVGHTGRLDPDAFLNRYASDASGNYFNYQNSHVEDLLVQGIQERDEAKRKEIYKEIQNILAEQVPAVYLQTTYSLMAANKKVQNLNIYPIDVFELREITIE
ncbi:MAG: hypothetical protein GX923_00530 [Clostridia bacterium]|jgi:peptide/nickel transport system substrate-binding protein|nr:hypothetical protein [Clostridia bacterium]